MANINANHHEGYGRFLSEDGNDEYGSFQVFWAHDDMVAEWNEHKEDKDQDDWEVGWYWWACFPGCLPDSDMPNGPFETSEEAYKDAREEE